jgi:hypothetical protein
VNSLTDGNLPAGYAPFNAQVLDGHLFVTYALQDTFKHDDVAGPGNGFVDEFSLTGKLIARVASNGPLDSPWGMAIAPGDFGKFAGDLLVGNFGDGTINAFNLKNDKFVGTLDGVDGKPITIGDLWTLTPGNGGMAGSKGEIFFTAGVQRPVRRHRPRAGPRQRLRDRRREQEHSTVHSGDGKLRGGKSRHGHDHYKCAGRNHHDIRLARPSCCARLSGASH